MILWFVYDQDCFLLLVLLLLLYINYFFSDANILTYIKEYNRSFFFKSYIVHCAFICVRLCTKCIYLYPQKRENYKDDKNIFWVLYLIFILRKTNALSHHFIAIRF